MVPGIPPIPAPSLASAEPPFAAEAVMEPLMDWPISALAEMVPELVKLPTS